MTPLCAGILVGGKSTRMGRDKASLRIGGTSLARRTRDIIAPFAKRVLLIGNADLPEDALSIERIVEESPGRGPLPAMVAAHHTDATSAWLFAACDLPLLSAAAVSWLIAQRASSRFGVCPQLAGAGLQPLLAIYEPAGLSALLEMYQRGERAPRLLAAHCDLATPIVPSELADAWRNVNTPEEWGALL